MLLRLQIFALPPQPRPPLKERAYGTKPRSRGCRRRRLIGHGRLARPATSHPTSMTNSCNSTEHHFLSRYGPPGPPGGGPPAAPPPLRTLPCRLLVWVCAVVVLVVGTEEPVTTSSPAVKPESTCACCPSLRSTVMLRGVALPFAHTRTVAGVAAAWLWLSLPWAPAP